MSKLDINTNGSWRLVMGDVRPAVADAVKQACMDLTASAAQTTGARSAPSWRLRDSFGQVFLRCECNAHTGVTAWTEPARQPAQGELA